MKLTYDREEDILMIEVIPEGVIDHAEQAGPFISHLTETGRLALLEVLDASEFLSQIIKITLRTDYATKTITTGEGGMIVTNDEALADRCRIMALHGISKDAWKRYTAEGSWYYEIIATGYKYNMTDIAAGMGLAQLGKAERMWRRRREIAGRYNASTMRLRVPICISS